MILKGKKGLIVGVANAKSIAYGIAGSLSRAGCANGVYLPKRRAEKRVEPIAQEFGSKFVYELDVKQSCPLGRSCGSYQSRLGEIDFVVHAVAYAPK